MDEDKKVYRLDTWDAQDRRVDVLGRRHRIRRPLDLDWREETSEPRRYPYKLNCLPGHEVVFRRSGWYKIDWCIQEDETPIRFRDTFAWITFDGERIGAVGFTEIDAWGTVPAEFWYQMDDYKSVTSRLADVLLSAWPELPCDLCQYGNVVEVGVVWVHPRHPQHGIWKPVLRELIGRVQMHCAIFVAHCFPLEYQGMLGPGSRLKIGFERRLSALMRVCEREFGLKPLPGTPGQSGFMWAPRPDLAQYIDEPTFSTEWLDEL